MPQLKRAGGLRGVGSLTTISLLQLSCSTFQLLFLSFTLWLCCPFISPAAVLFADNFDLGLDWDFYTNDDNKTNGWDLVDGCLVQKEPNGDVSPGGERWLVRPEALDLSKATLPLHIFLDIMPLDYRPPKAVWFGFGFLVDEKRPDNGNVLVALQKGEEQELDGLHVAIVGKRPIYSASNFKLSLWRWYRLHIVVDQFIPGKLLHLRVRIWPRALPEPQDWMTECTIKEETNWQAKGISLGMYAHQGKKGNPRAALDNLWVVEDQLTSETELLLSQASLRQQALSSLLREFERKELEAVVRRNGPCSPLYSGIDEALFFQILALRKQRKWAESRQLANQLISLFPGSPFVDHMGGAEGRTEDEAAFAHADASKPYFAREFDQSLKLLDEFLEHYPNNWRRDYIELHRNRALYFGGREDEFMNVSSEIVNSDPDFPYLDELLYLQTAVLIHKADGEGARRLLDHLEKYYAYSRWVGEFSQLRLESWFVNDLASITSETIHIVMPLYQKQLAYAREINRWYAKNLTFGIKLYKKLGLSLELDEVFRDEMATLESGDKKYPWLCLGYAEYLEKIDDVDRAIGFLTSTLDELTERSYERSRILERLSTLYLQQNQAASVSPEEPFTDNALKELFEQEITQSADEPQYCLRVTSVYVRYLMNNREQDKAIEKANQILKGQQTSCEERDHLLRLLARIYAGKGELDKARALLCR